MHCKHSNFHGHFSHVSAQNISSAYAEIIGFFGGMDFAHAPAVMSRNFCLVLAAIGAYTLGSYSAPVIAAGSSAPEDARLQAKERADGWNPPRFFAQTGDYDKLCEDKSRHAEFVRGFKENYSPWAEIVAQEVGVPSQLLLAVIANEQVFYSHAEHFVERFSVGASIGLAQIKATTLHAHGLYTATSERTLKQALKLNSFNIFAASKLLRNHFKTLCHALGSREAGGAEAASDSFINDVLEGEDVCTAERVCSLMNESPEQMDRSIQTDPDFGHCLMKASVAFWISGEKIVYRREIKERRPNTMKRSRDGARLFRDFISRSINRSISR